VGVLMNPTNPAMEMLRDGEAAALRRLGMEAFFVDVTAVGELDTANREVKRRGAQAIIVHADSLFVAHRVAIMQLCRAQRLPALGEGRQFVVAGAIVSYAPDTAAMTRNAAGFLDRIFKGARAGDLPIERPTHFQLAVNMGTAKALGVVIPPTLLARADEVIH
jgi:putative ABC transport system substrate-binding protein